MPVFLKLLLMSIGYVLYYVILSFLFVFLFQIWRTIRKNRCKKHHSLRFKLKHDLWHIRDKRFMKLFEFMKWVLIDILRGKDRLKLFGIWCFTGYYGEGKTFGAVNFALQLKEKYPDIKIYSNFEMRGSSGRITCPEDIVKLEFIPGRKIIIFDEIQSTFSSTQYAAFPMELLWGLTQCRKNGMCVFASSPVYTRMSIQLRESTDKIIVCKNVLGLDRWFRYTFYRSEDYEAYKENKIRLMTHVLFTISHIAHDRDYKRYDTKQIVERFDIEDKKPVTKQTEARLKNEILKIVEEKIKLLEKKIA